VWSDQFCVGREAAGEILLAGRVFADNLPRPTDFVLTIGMNVARSRMTLRDLIALPDPPRSD
jgi:hypothetical protein